ncbi:tripartite tricarboxylate transporter substrate binding protein [Rhabdaerophilum sp. SD176]|uniref:Bug family tripartite tricarboxylate transporter substrate binding protein n=1 Tax=Rhabdaerophilum sp. SD176 TaxID=2983548 RepID=UPI0024DF5710|nr:tripartite tricarboxylate transporter substrate binding protein [Rhabdaerophilum sp. SD176]
MAHLLSVFLGLLLAFPGFSPAMSQTRFPEKTIQIIAPYAPGGAADIFARMIAGDLEKRLGQSVIVVNRPGAGTIIGAQALIAAPADGYTLFLSSNSTFTLNPAVIPKIPYDATKDFEPIAQLATIGLVLLTHADNPVRDVAGLVAAARAEPDKLNMASFGNATVSHFGGEWFKATAGIRMVHVPYRGSGPAMNDLVARHIPYLVDTIVAAKPQVEAGKIRPLAVTMASRSAMMPDVPTLRELGYKDIDLSSWVALVTAKGVPADARRVLSDAVAAMLQDPVMKEKMLKAGFEPAYRTYPDWSATIAAEIAAMKAIAAQAGIKAE